MSRVCWFSCAARERPRNRFVHHRRKGYNQTNNNNTQSSNLWNCCHISHIIYKTMFRFLNRSVQSSNFRLLRPATITIDLFVNNFYNFFGCQVILPRYSTTTSHDDLLNVYRPAHRGCCSSIPNSLLHACVAGWSFIMLNCHSNDRSSPTFKQSTEDGRTA